MVLKEKNADTSSLTVTRYRQIWNKYYDNATLSDMPISEIKAADLKNFFKELTAGRVMSRKNFINIKSIFNVVFDIAVDNDIVTSNLSRNISCKDLKFKAVDNENIRYTDEDRDKTLSYIDELPEKTGYEYGIELMFCLFVRIGELRAFRWSDVDFRKHTISISREIVLRNGDDGKNHFIEVTHTKGGEHGAIVLPLSERAEKGNGSSRYPHLSSHKIRFWSVTALARATGGDIQTVMYAAGHVDKNTTLHYIIAVQSDTQAEKIRECFD